MENSQELRGYLIVTAAYWAFTLTDGALRMLVLGHFHALGYAPYEIALLFLLYEFFGVVTNLIGGWIGSRTGLRLTLLVGLGLQVAALAMLSGLSTGWAQATQVAFVIVAQGISGIAKDFTKMSSKSAIKVLVPGDANGTLFRWVALLTGSKNTLKGVGFFLGGLLLGTAGFRNALWGMAAALLIVIGLVAALLPASLGKASKRFKFSDTLRGNRAIRILSTARMLLFCARDVWFVVALPVFLAEILGWDFAQVGTYLALWVIGYGAVQALSPRLLRRLGNGQVSDSRSAQIWGGVLAAIPLGMYGLLRLDFAADVIVLGGLAIFGIVFAINSAVHSYLVLAYSESDKVSLNVGFYYMANALGRLLGTLLSGLLYQAGGMGLCLLTAAAMVALSSLVALGLPNTRDFSAQAS